MTEKYDPKFVYSQLVQTANGIDPDRYITIEEYARQLRAAEDVALTLLKDKSE